MSNRIHFPKNFTWGAATSCYQIEGATTADGRGESIWDRFATKKGAILDGTDGSIACEHYTRWPEDIALMRELGLHAYRFSVAWPRVLPQGTGRIEERGLAFYDRLVDGLLEAGIRPSVTLYHWDLPQVLEDKGGWVNRETVEAFVAYADVVTRRLGDRVGEWITHNEPWCAAMLGYKDGYHAPGIKSTPKALAAAHHMLLSHGRAVPVIRRNSPDARVGITLNLVDPHPASPSKEDAEACRKFDGSFNRWFLDPVFGRGYPEDVVEDYRKEGHVPEGPLPFVKEGDQESMGVETDFLGLNYYSRAILRDDSAPNNLPRTILEPANDQKTDIGWEIFPEGLSNLLLRVHREYGPDSLVVTENGAAYHTRPANGRVPDERRRDYLHRHFLEARKVIDSGVPLHAYYVWSLMDNYEWAFGYSQRFGITWVNYETQERILKDSARWYKDVIAHNGVPPIQEEQ